MTTTSFHYEVHADAGLAYDATTGTNAKTYMKFDIDMKKELTEEEYTQVHVAEVIELLAKRGLKKEYVKPISEADYSANQEDSCTK